MCLIFVNSNEPGIMKINENRSVCLEKPLYFTQLFTKISNFAIEIVNFALVVLSRGSKGAWIGV